MNSKGYLSSFIQLISVNSFGKLIIHPSATPFIRNLPSPISIASIIGPRSSGKSFLLNQIATEFTSTNLHTDSSTPTSSIWVSSKPLLGYNQTGKITSILLFDTPGLTLENQPTQEKILTLIMLISNCLFYNTLSTLSPSFIEQIKEILNLLQLMPPFSKLSDQKNFHFIFRDFSSRLQNEFGSSISPKQYFQNFLLSFSNNSFQTTINSLKYFLPKRDCHFLTKPALEQSEQQPLFCQQVIELRKSLTNISSFDIQGSDFILLLQTYIDALNNNDSLQKVFQEGIDCLTRIKCLDKLNNQLRSLSLNSIDGIDEKLLDIKSSLNEYFKQTMISTKQIQALDEDLSQIINDFRQINELRPTQSRVEEYSNHLINIRYAKPQKGVRLSLNVSDSDADKNEQEYKSPLSLNRINTSKLIQSKLEEYQAKIYRYELQANYIRHQALNLQEECQKSKKQLEQKQQEVQQLFVSKTVKQKELSVKINELQQRIKQLQKQNLLALSQNEKITLLNNDKINYLLNELNEQQHSFASEKYEREEKYRSKINQYMQEITELNKAHEEQITQLKVIYKSNIDKINQSTSTARSHRLINPSNQDTEIIEQLTQTNQKYKSKITDLENINSNLQQKIKATEERSKLQIQKIQKRLKEVQQHLHHIYSQQVTEKDNIIREIQVKNGELSMKLQQLENNYNKCVYNSNYQIRQLQQNLLQHESNFQSLSNESIKLKNRVRQLQMQLLQKIKLVQILQNKNIDIKSKLKQLQQEKSILQEHYQNMKNSEQQLRYQTAIEKQRLVLTLQTKIQQNQSNKAKMQREINEIKQLNQVQKTALMNRLQELSQQSQSNRQYKYLYEESQTALMDRQQQFADINLQNQLLLCNLRKQLEQVEEQLTSKEQHIKFLNESMNNINEQFSNYCQQHSSQMQQLQNHSSQKINAYLIQITKLKMQYNDMYNQFQKGEENWKIKQAKYEQKLKILMQQHQKQKQMKQSLIQESNRQILLTQKEHTQKEIQLLKENNNIVIYKIELQLKQKINLLKKSQETIQQLKSNSSEREKQVKQQKQFLKKEIEVREVQRNILVSNISTIEEKYHHQKQKTANYINLLQKKLQQTKYQYQKLHQLLEQYKLDYQSIKTTKDLIEHNYNRDCILWAQKYELLKQREFIDL